MSGLLGGLAAALACSGAAWAGCSLGAVSLPVTMDGPQAMMTVKVNGAEGQFTIDTGAFYSVITPGYVSQFGLKSQPAAFGFEIKGAGGLVSPNIVRVKSLGFAEASLKDIPFLVDDNELGGAGLIGQNFLGVWDAEYDFANAKVALVKPRGCDGHAMAYWGKPGDSYNVLKLEPNDNPLNRRIVATIKINGVPMKALFDTGAGSSILTVAGARRAGVPLEGDGVVAAGEMRGVGRRSIALRVSPIREVEIDNEIIKNTRIKVADLDMEADVVLGADFFLAHHIYVANSQNRLYFTYNGGPVFNLSAPPAPRPATTIAAADLELKDAAAFARRGSVRLARQDYAGAKADLDRAVALEPGSSDHRLQRAKASLALKSLSEAQADLDSAAALAPGDAEVRLWRARVRIARQTYPEAKSDLAAAEASLAPQADERYLAGALRLAARDPQGALADYDGWLRFHPLDNRKPGALLGRCWARVLAGTELDKAASDCDAAHRALPRSERVLVVRAFLDLRRGAREAAKADFDAAQGLNANVAARLWVASLDQAPWAKDAAQGLGPKTKVDAPKPPIDPEDPDEATEADAVN